MSKKDDALKLALEALKELVVVATHEKLGSTCLMKAKAAIAKGEQK